MKASRFVLAGGILILVAIILFFRASKSPAPQDATGQGLSGGKGHLAGSEPNPSGSSPVRRGRSEASPQVGTPSGAEAGFPARLETLWQRPDEEALLDALDKVADFPDPAQWRQVSDVLVRRASTEARGNIIDYLLATADAAPDDVRISIYAAALDNRAPGVSDSARLELENITGKRFASGDEARAWLGSHPPAVPEEAAGQ